MTSTLIHGLIIVLLGIMALYPQKNEELNAVPMGRALDILQPVVQTDFLHGQTCQIQAQKGSWNIGESSNITLMGNIQLLAKDQQFKPSSLTYDFKDRWMVLENCESHGAQNIIFEYLLLDEHYEVAQCQDLLFAGIYPQVQFDDLELISVKNTKASPAIFKSPIFSRSSSNKQENQANKNSITTTKTAQSHYTMKALEAEMICSSSKVRLSMNKVQFITGNWTIESETGRCRSGDPLMLFSGGVKLTQGAKARAFERATFNPTTGIFTPDEGAPIEILPQ